MYLIKIIVHQDGERLPILVNEKGFPYIQPNVFISTQRGLAWRTLKKKLYSISQLYKWADANSIDIQERVSSGQFFSESEINASLFSAIRKSGSKTKVTKVSVGAKTFNTYMIYIREYMQWIFSSYLMTLPSTDQRFNVLHNKQKIISGWLSQAKISSSNAENEIHMGTHY